MGLLEFENLPFLLDGSEVLLYSARAMMETGKGSPILGYIF